MFPADLTTCCPKAIVRVLNGSAAEAFGFNSLPTVAVAPVTQILYAHIV